MEDLLDQEEVARMLGVSPRTLLRMRQHGHGPEWIRVGKTLIRYRPEAVAKWLEELHGRQE
jgi:predicted DNA-binding transcriptional regulator AlpA